MRLPDGKRDSAYGVALLTLRTRMALSRAELANSMGVSRQAVGEWERGRGYPKTEHLKALIALVVKSQAFAAENEAEEIRLLWNVAHLKMPIDERWLSALLEHSPSLERSLGTPPVKETRISAPITVNREQRSSGSSRHDQRLTPHPLQSGPLVDWGDALAVPVFYGREQEMAQLSQWVVQKRCRVVSVLGLGGIGKSTLVVSMMHQFSSRFEVVIFRSLRDAPSCEVVLDDCLQMLSPRLLSIIPANLEQRINLLLERLRKTRTLVVLDNLECLLLEGDPRGHFRPGFEGYGRLLHRMVETSHQGCLLLTSREKPAELRLMESRYSEIRSLRLEGLDVAACQQIFVEKEVVGTKEDVERLIQAYGGNPLALKIVAETILDLLGGEIGLFLAGGAVIFGSITDLLDEQFARLSALEQSVLCWLAIVREPVTLDELQALLVIPLPRVQLFEAIDGLRRRSLIERGKRSGSFTLQAVVLEYVTTVLIAEGSREIQQHRLDRLGPRNMCGRHRSGCCSPHCLLTYEERIRNEAN